MQIICICLLIVAMCYALSTGHFVSAFFIALIGFTAAMVGIGELVCSLGNRG